MTWEFLEKDHYILEERSIRAVDMLTWATWFESHNRNVAKTDMNGIRISTIFLGLDHNHFQKGPPLLFETMVFGGEHDGDMARCSTYAQAERMHIAVVRKVLGNFAAVITLLAIGWNVFLYRLMKVLLK